MTRRPEPPSMEELGLDPRSEFDCDAFAGFLEQEAVAEVEEHLADENAVLAATDMTDQVVLDAIDRASRTPDSARAERIVAAAHRAADAYLADRLPAQWRLHVTPPLTRPRRRERRARRASRQRVRTRSGSRGDPPDDPDDEPPGVELAPGQSTGRLTVETAA